MIPGAGGEWTGGHMGRKIMNVAIALVHIREDEGQN
jgi:hypothetical protein